MSWTNKAQAERLFHSCRVLFGPRVDVSWGFLYHIQMSGLKSMFRERALLTHPDRALLRGEASPRPDRFIAARDAYEHLSRFIRTRHTLRPPGGRAPRHRPAPKPDGAEQSRPPGRKRGGRSRRGGLPNRRLLFGEFLLYDGHIGWDTLIKAVVWQRRQRPKLGDMASARGWISPGQARAVAGKKKPGAYMGEELVRRGLLTPAQVKSLLWRQRYLQQPLGNYFAVRGHLAQTELEALAQRCRNHNRAFGKKSA